VSTERPRDEGAVRRLLLAPRIVAVVAAGGALGALARSGLDLLLPHEAGSIPWSTLLANVVGSFLIGVAVVVLLERRRPSSRAYPFAATGVLGGFTTFSSYAVQARVLVGEGEVALAGGYVVGTLLLAVLAVRLGAASARRALGPRR
jgi:CrcB protein